jgi:DNA-directed RNA polymerase subunit M/transcription elongation factor TFIIS
MIRFACPTCNGVISTSSKRAGTVKACPGCGQMVQVPAAAEFKQEKPEKKKAAAPTSKPTPVRRGGGMRTFWTLVRLFLWGGCFGAVVLGVVSYFAEYAKASVDQAKIEIAARALVWIIGPFYLARTFESASKSFEELLQRFRRKS